MRISRLLAAPAVLLVRLAVASPSCMKTYDIPNVWQNGSVGVEFQSVPGNLDGQKIYPGPNRTAYDWFYFDAVSAGNMSFQIVFYEFGPDSLGYTGAEALGAAAVIVWASFDNGTAVQLPFPVDPSLESAVHIEVGTPGVKGDWKSTGAKFEGSSIEPGSHALYTITMDNDAIGVHGTMTLKSRAPAHYPCGLNEPGQNEEVCPGVGWANAIPDAYADVDFIVGGEPVKFTGVGYHDKNWGVTPFTDHVQSWFWGHSHFGPYSIVWFDTRGTDGIEYFSAYVAKDGKVLSSSCKAGSVIVRPYGPDTYPPTPEDGNPHGYNIHFDLGKEGTLQANASVEAVVAAMSEGTYGRYVGSVTGGLVGKETFTGRALFEQFMYPL